MSEGIVYFIQPSELVGSNRFKIGCSKSPNLKRCNTGYRNGSRYICIMESPNPMKIEAQIKLVFKTQFKLISGTEFFEGDELLMLESFNKIIIEYKKSENTTITKSMNNVDTNNDICHIANNDVDKLGLFICKICNNNYTSYQSLWNHANKYHIIEKRLLSSNLVNNKHLINIKLAQNHFDCIYCNKTFTRKNNLNYHIKNKCKEIGKIKKQP